MPKIRQLETSPEEVTQLKRIEDAIAQELPELSPKDRLPEILEDEGAGLRDVVGRIAYVHKNTQDEKLVHDTGKTLLQLHGVMKDSDAAATPSIQIMIMDKDVQLGGILKPRI